MYKRSDIKEKNFKSKKNSITIQLRRQQKDKDEVLYKKRRISNLNNIDASKGQTEIIKNFQKREIFPNILFKIVQNQDILEQVPYITQLKRMIFSYHGDEHTLSLYVEEIVASPALSILIEFLTSDKPIMVLYNVTYILVNISHFSYCSNLLEKGIINRIINLMHNLSCIEVLNNLLNISQNIIIDCIQQSEINIEFVKALVNLYYKSISFTTGGKLSEKILEILFQYCQKKNKIDASELSRIIFPFFSSYYTLCAKQLTEDQFYEIIKSMHVLLKGDGTDKSIQVLLHDEKSELLNVIMTIFFEPTVEPSLYLYVLKIIHLLTTSQDVEKDIYFLIEKYPLFLSCLCNHLSSPTSTFAIKEQTCIIFSNIVVNLKLYLSKIIELNVFKQIYSIIVVNKDKSLMNSSIKIVTNAILTNPYTNIMSFPNIVETLLTACTSSYLPDVIVDILESLFIVLSHEKSNSTFKQNCKDIDEEYIHYVEALQNNENQTIAKISQSIMKIFSESCDLQ